MVFLKIFAVLMLAILFFGVEGEKMNRNKLIESCKKITGAIKEAFDENCHTCTYNQVRCTAQVVKNSKKVYESCANHQVQDEKIRCIRKVVFEVSRKYSLAKSCFGNYKPCGPYPA
ncbi:Uncharacterised protein g4712 [Pycnogonum litorale]